MYDISLVFPYSRPQLIRDVLKSLEGNKCSYELVMLGEEPIDYVLPHFCTVIISHVKPAQLWEAGMRRAQGKLVCWTADDAEYSPNALDLIVSTFVEIPNPKLFVGMRTFDDGIENTYNNRLYQPNPSTPLCSTVGVVRKSFWLELGGIDRRFVGGQWENDISMRILEAGGTFFIHKYVICFLEHKKKHGKPMEESTMVIGYSQGRSVLEPLWLDGRNFSGKRRDAVQVFSDEGILEKSQGEKRLINEVGNIIKEWP